MQRGLGVGIVEALAQANAKVGESTRSTLSVSVARSGVGVSEVGPGDAGKSRTSGVPSGEALAPLRDDLTAMRDGSSGSLTA